MSDIAIRVENLSKRYSKHTASSGLGRHVRRWLGGSRAAGNVVASGNTATSGSAPSSNNSLTAPEPASDDFWALKDVSFEVKHGEVIGVIGRNGAGKSTLLKILSKITAPTSGRAHIYGRVGSLLEVGTGFHPELTGRENIFLNGAVLRMSRREIRDKFDEIVDFAEVAEFIDTPVKHYSSGMYMRLAFAVAAHLDPEILIVDEVLAVGDAAFQKKCLGKMGDVSRTGRTVLFVSHNMLAMEKLCEQSICLSHGQVKCAGPTKLVVKNYLSDSQHSSRLEVRLSKQQTSRSCPSVRLLAARIANESRPGVTEFTVRDKIRIEFEYENMIDGAVLNPSVVLVSDDGQPVFNTAPLVEESMYSYARGHILVGFRIPSALLNDGIYRIRFLIVRDGGTVLLDEHDLLTFEVADIPEERSGWFGKWIGAVRPRLDWFEQCESTKRQGALRDW